MQNRTSFIRFYSKHQSTDLSYIISIPKLKNMFHDLPFCISYNLLQSTLAQICSLITTQLFTRFYTLYSMVIARSIKKPINKMASSLLWYLLRIILYIILYILYIIAKTKKITLFPHVVLLSNHLTFLSSSVIILPKLYKFSASIAFCE